MNTNVAAPRSINYGDQLPLGIESRSQQKLFFPSTGGGPYSGDGTNICRIDLSYDGLIDFANSYLTFKITNTNTDAYSLDLGQPVIQRLRIECGGVVLEDIQNYNHLLGGILTPAQNGLSNTHTDAFNVSQPCMANVVTGHGNVTTTAPTDVQMSQHFASASGASGAVGNVVREAVNNNFAFTAANPITGAGAGFYNILVGGAVAEYSTRHCCYKLVSGLLDNDKYIPMMLLNAPITLEITFAPQKNSGCIAGGQAFDGAINITDVRYVAHTIDLERSFYDRLRMVQQSSGGVLQIAGTSFRNYVGSIGTTGQQSINIPARLRSIKSVFWKAMVNDDDHQFTLSGGGHANITGYQVKIGGNNYPPTKITANQLNNKITPYLQLQKAFGKLGSTVHSDLLCPINYLTDLTGTTGNVNGCLRADVQCAFAPYGLDLESFRHEIENGINTSGNALVMSLELDQSAALAAALPLQVFVMYDSLFYVNMDGTISVST